MLALIIGAAAVVAFHSRCSFSTCVRRQTMTATQTPLRRELCSTRRERIRIGESEEEGS
jgi:hypothetical protein